MMHQGNDPHKDTPVYHAGASLEEAKAVMIMIHGRGAAPQNILELTLGFGHQDVAYLAPQAAANTWYPYSFMEPTDANEPSLTSALGKVESVLNHALEAGFPPEKVMFLGFSQGACLASEFVARNPKRYGGLAVLSGGVIGKTIRDYGHQGENPLDDMPVFIGCSDVDSHIPESRVHETTEVFNGLGADVTEKIYPGMAHTIIQDEIDHVKQILDGVVEA